MATLNFDANTVQPMEPQEALPAGWYTAIIDQSEMKPASREGNYYLELRFNVVDPSAFAGRKVFTRLNLRNDNPKAQEIAYRELSAICRHVGVMQVQDSAQLHGRPLKIKLKVRPAEGEYEASNDVRSFAGANDAVGMAAPAAAAPWAASPPAATPQAPAQAWAQAPAQAPAAPVAPPAAWAPPATAQPWAAAPAPQAAPPAPVQPAAPVQAAPVQPQADTAAPAWMAAATAAAAGSAPPWANAPSA